MTAEILREAASLMRERAEATTRDAAWTDGHYWIPDYDMYGEPVQAEIGGMGGTGDAAHYSSWHPAVALAVAEWLDAYAERLEVLGHAIGSNHGQAFAVARAYLGRDA